MIVWSWPPLRRHGALLREPGAAAEPPADYGRPGGRRRPVPGSGAGDGGPGLLRAACTVQCGRGRRSPRPLPVPEDRLARVRPPARVAVSPEDIEWLAGEVPASYRALRLVGGVLGLRWGEAVGLRMADVDFLRRTITVRQVVEEMAGHMDIAAEAKSAARPRTLSTPLSASGFFIDEVADHVARFRTDGRSDPLSLAGGVSRASSTRTLTVYAGMVDEWTFVGNSGTAVRRSPIRRGCPTARHSHAGAPCSTD